MVRKFSVTSNFGKVVSSFRKLKNEIKRDVIRNGLTEILEKSTESLKADLLSTFKEQLGTEAGEHQKDKGSAIQEKVNVPKSQDTILKHLTGVDLKEFNTQRNSSDYHTQVGGPKLVHAQRSSGQNAPARVSLKIPIGEGETVKSQFQKAKEFFREALFAFPMANGRTKFVANNDSELEKNIKIKCSSYTGDDDFNEFGGTSPEKRFEMDIERGYAEWTLKQEFVNKLQDSGVNISKVIDDVLEGRYEDAKNYLGAAREAKSQEIMNKVTDLENNENLSPETASANNIVQLIKNLKVRRQNKGEKTVYKLMSSFYAIKDVDFNHELHRQISIWKNINVDVWIKEFLRKLDVVINKFYSGKK